MDITTVLGRARTTESRTKRFHAWMKRASDDIKMRYAINWRLPHSLFNVSSHIFNGDDIQNIDWYTIFKSRNLGKWSNGNKVLPKIIG